MNRVLFLVVIFAIAPLSVEAQTPVTGNGWRGPVEGRSVYEVTVDKEGVFSGRLKISGGKDVGKTSPVDHQDRAHYNLRTMTYFYKEPEVVIVGEAGAPQKVIEGLVSTCLQGHINSVKIESGFTTAGWSNFRMKPKSKKKVPEVGEDRPQPPGTQKEGGR